MRIAPCLALLLSITALLHVRVANAATRLHYVAYAGGLRVIDVGVDIDLSPSDYRVGLTLRTVGFFGAFVPGLTTTDVSGEWAGQGVSPRRYDSHGEWRGEHLSAVIDYLPTGPRVRELLPAHDVDERDPVPEALQIGTVDTLSGMAALVRQIGRSGECAARMRLFDGRRLSDVESRSAGMQVLEATSRSVFKGPALRCDFEGRLLAGFPRDEDHVRAARPKTGSAWFAQLVPGGPPLPVRITFETRFFGHATMYLAAE